MCSLRIKEAKFLHQLGLPLHHCHPCFVSAREKQLKRIEAWKDELFNGLLCSGKIPANVRGFPSFFLTAADDSSFPFANDLGMAIICVGFLNTFVHVCDFILNHFVTPKLKHI